MVVPAPPEPTEIVGDFSAFYRRELSGQVRRATLLVGDREVARDLVHDAFADVYTRWATLREAGPYYLNVAVLNRCRDHARRTSRAGQRLRLRSGNLALLTLPWVRRARCHRDW
jgi:DNA-directed RNA polymerase specialized sigma24 family protein